jgi:hypothetical protein
MSLTQKRTILLDTGVTPRMSSQEDDLVKKRVPNKIKVIRLFRVSNLGGENFKSIREDQERLMLM